MIILFSFDPPEFCRRNLHGTAESLSITLRSPSSFYVESHLSFYLLFSALKKKKKNEQSLYEVNEAARWLHYDFVVKK